MTPTMATIWNSVVSFERQHPNAPQIILLDRETFRDLLREAGPWTRMEITNSPVPTLFSCELFLVRRPQGTTEKIVIVK